MGWLEGWTALVLAGCLEVGFTTFMKLSDGFRHLWWSVGFGICATLSFVLLSIASRQIPMGTAYGVWTGIGAVGTTLVGIFLFGDPAGAVRLILIAVLIGSVVGLKLAH